MDGPRCLVEVWADFGDLLSANVMSHGADVILSTGSNDVFIFSGQERKVKASEFSGVCIIVAVFI